VSDVGRVRSRNEDFCGEFSNSSGYRLLVVADGMGGHRAGATASHVAVDAIGEVFEAFDGEPESMLARALETANQRVYQMATENEELRGMGTTAVALLFGPDGGSWVAHVGDSRAYRYRDARLEPLTRDHSVVAELERRGLITSDEAAAHPRRNEILRCVGVHPEVEVEISEIELEVGDRFLLCSDGLSGLVDDSEIASILDANPAPEAAQLLVDNANERGGHDNVTVQIADYMQTDPTPEQPNPVARDTTYVALQDESVVRRRRMVVVCAVVLAGLAALTLLWQVYSMNRAGRAEPGPSSTEVAE
jgi:protein phosphatase